MKEGDYLKDLGIDGRIILMCILKNQERWVWTGFIWLMTGNICGSL
jgi:hypothetical protein